MTRLDELMLNWQDQALTPEQNAELKQLLAATEGKARLAEQFFLTGVVLEALRVQSAAGETQDPDEGRQSISEPFSAGRAAGNWRTLAGMVGMAAAVLVCLTTYFWFFKQEQLPVQPKNPPAPTFAEVERVKGEIFVVGQQKSRPALVGQALAPGEGIATEGPDSEAVVQIKDSVRLTLAGDTTLFTSVEKIQPGGEDLKLVLEKGDLLVEVTRALKRKKMTVQTPLGLAIAESEEAALHLSDAAGIVVLRGEVTFVHKTTGKSLRLGEGMYLAVAGSGELYSSRFLSGNSRIWTTFPRTGLSTSFLGYSLAFSPDGKHLAAVHRSGLGGLRVGAVEAHEPPRELRGDRWVQYSPDGNWLAAADQTSVRLHDLTQKGQDRIFSPMERKGRVQCLSFSPDGQVLAVGRAAAKGSTELEIWDITSGTCLSAWRSHHGPLTCLVFSPDGKQLVSGSHDRSVIFWDLAQGQEKFRIVVNPAQVVWSLSFAPMGNDLAIATGPEDFRLRQPGEVILWDLTGQKIRTRLQGHTRAVTSLVFSRDGQSLITGSADTTVRFWDLKSEREYGMLKGHKAAPGFEAIMVALSPAGDFLATASFDQNVKIWPTTWIRNHPPASARLFDRPSFFSPVLLRDEVQ